MINIFFFIFLFIGTIKLIGILHVNAVEGTLLWLYFLTKLLSRASDFSCVLDQKLLEKCFSNKLRFLHFPCYQNLYIWFAVVLESTFNKSCHLRRKIYPLIKRTKLESNNCLPFFTSLIRVNLESNFLNSSCSRAKMPSHSIKLREYKKKSGSNSQTNVA